MGSPLHFGNKYLLEILQPEIRCIASNFINKEDWVNFHNVKRLINNN